MIDASLLLTASRGTGDTSMPTSDYRVEVVFTGANFATSEATMLLDSREIIHDFQANVHTFFAHAIGAPAREWPAIGGSLGLSVTPLDDYSGIEQNLAKAGMLVATWVEPYVVAGASDGLADELVDELIVDYTGHEGPQRLIYFPPLDLLDEGVERELYEAQLLCRLTLRIVAATVMRSFVPLVIPLVGPNTFRQIPCGADASRKWRLIRERMRDRIHRVVGR